MNIERMAEAVHSAYLETCERLGWPVKPTNAVPYRDLSEEAKALDRASVRAVLHTLHDEAVIARVGKAIFDEVKKYPTNMGDAIYGASIAWGATERSVALAALRALEDDTAEVSGA